MLGDRLQKVDSRAELEIATLEASNPFTVTNAPVCASRTTFVAAGARFAFGFWGAVERVFAMGLIVAGRRFGFEPSSERHIGHRADTRGETFPYPRAIISRIRRPSVSTTNGLVSTAMPGSSWPLPTAAFSA